MRGFLLPSPPFKKIAPAANILSGYSVSQEDTWWRGTGVIRPVRPPTHCYRSAKTEKYQKNHYVLFFSELVVHFFAKELHSKSYTFWEIVNSKS